MELFSYEYKSFGLKTIGTDILRSQEWNALGRILSLHLADVPHSYTCTDLFQGGPNPRRRQLGKTAGYRFSWFWITGFPFVIFRCFAPIAGTLYLSFFPKGTTGGEDLSQQLAAILSANLGVLWLSFAPSVRELASYGCIQDGGTIMTEPYLGSLGR